MQIQLILDNPDQTKPRLEISGYLTHNNPVVDSVQLLYETLTTEELLHVEYLLGCVNKLLKK